MSFQFSSDINSPTNCNLTSWVFYFSALRRWTLDLLGLNTKVSWFTTFYVVSSSALSIHACRSIYRSIPKEIEKEIAKEIKTAIPPRCPPQMMQKGESEKLKEGIREGFSFLHNSDCTLCKKFTRREFAFSWAAVHKARHPGIFSRTDRASFVLPNIHWFPSMLPTQRDDKDTNLLPNVWYALLCFVVFLLFVYPPLFQDLNLYPTECPYLYISFCTPVLSPTHPSPT